MTVGGYQPERLAEEHAFGLVVLRTAVAAQRPALIRSNIPTGLAIARSEVKRAARGEDQTHIHFSR